MIRIRRWVERIGKRPTTRRGGWFWKAGWTVVWLGILMTSLILAQESTTLTVVLLAGVAVVGLIWWWRRSSQGAGIAVSLAAAMVLTSQITYWIGGQADAATPIHMGLAYWIFAAVIALVGWLTPSRGRHRAVTVALAHAVLVIVSPATYLAPSFIPIIAFLLALVVVVWRTRPRRRANQATSDQADAAAPRRLTRSRGAGRTARELGRLGEEWTVLTGRRLADSNVELAPIAVRGSSLFLVETRSWAGRIAPMTYAVDGHETTAYGLDDDPAALGAALRPIVDRAAEISERLRHDPVRPHVVVAFWDSTSLPEPSVEMSVYGTDADGERLAVEVCLVRGKALADWLGRRPEEQPHRSLAGRVTTAVRRRAGRETSLLGRLERVFPVVPDETPGGADRPAPNAVSPSEKSRR